MIVKTFSQLSQALANFRLKKDIKIALVPTMGNLHDGHLHLISESYKVADIVCVSIFVNKNQFAIGEDFDAYPRTEEADIAKITDMLLSKGIKLQSCIIYLPSYNEVYQQDARLYFDIPSLTHKLCGLSRPQMFNGVMQVLLRFFKQVNPDFVLMGQKDYQQHMVVSAFAKELFANIAIIPVKTQRNLRGLALSSRNSYLTIGKKRQAAILYQSLKFVASVLNAKLMPSQDNWQITEDAILCFKKQISYLCKIDVQQNTKLNTLLKELDDFVKTCNINPNTDENIMDIFLQLKQHIAHILTLLDFNIDYLELYNQQDLSQQGLNKNNIRLFVAARLCGVRLIDNLALQEVPHQVKLPSLS